MPTTILARKTKTSGEELPYTIELAGWISSLGESYATAEWTVTAPAEPSLTIVSEAVLGTRAVATLADGTDGVTYTVRCRATSVPTGRVGDFVITLEIEDP